MYLSHNIVKELVTLETSLSRLLESSVTIDEDNQLIVEDLTSLAQEYGLSITPKDARRIISKTSGQTAISEDEPRSNSNEDTLLENFVVAAQYANTIKHNRNTYINNHTLLELLTILGKSLQLGEDQRFRNLNEFPNDRDEFLGLFQSTKYHTAEPEAATELLLQEFAGGNEQRFYKLSQLAFELLLLQPMVNGNRLVISLLLEILLGRMLEGVDLKISFVSFFTEYKEKLKKLKLITELPSKEVYWHEVFIDYIGVKMAKFVEEALAKNPAVKDENKKLFIDLNKRQLRILKYLQTIPVVRREDYVQMLNISTMTAYRDLNQLVRAKLIKTAGTGRGTKYMLMNR